MSFACSSPVPRGARTQPLKFIPIPMLSVRVSALPSTVGRTETAPLEESWLIESSIWLGAPVLGVDSEMALEQSTTPARSFHLQM